jgi:hypothetical protein
VEERTRFATAAAPLLGVLARGRPFPGSCRIVSARPASHSAPLDPTIGKHDLPANRRDRIYEPYAVTVCVTVCDGGLGRSGRARLRRRWQNGVAAAVAGEPPREQRLRRVSGSGAPDTSVLRGVIAKAVTPAATVRRVRDQAGGVLGVAFGEEAELCARVYLPSARLLLPGRCGLRAST